MESGDVSMEDGDVEGEDTQLITADDIEPDTQKGIDDVDDGTLKKLAATPAFTGAIPIAIFDAASKHFNDDPTFAETAFDLCAEFDQSSSTKQILEHILNQLQTAAPDSVEAIICESKMALFKCPADSGDFPSALGTALVTMKKGRSMLETEKIPFFAEKAVLLFVPYLRSKGELDEDVATVLEAGLTRHLKMLPAASTSLRRGGPPTLTSVIENLRKEGRDADVEIIESYTSKT